jgi:hypothetical protein
VPHFRLNNLTRFRIVWGETEGAAKRYFTPTPESVRPAYVRHTDQLGWRRLSRAS